MKKKQYLLPLVSYRILLIFEKPKTHLPQCVTEKNSPEEF